jgi:hypothetical protein
MADNRHQRQSPPMANYSSAVARAIEWLGDSYLLARPINAAPRPATRVTPGTAAPRDRFSKK